MPEQLHFSFGLSDLHLTKRSLKPKIWEVLMFLQRCV